MVTAPKKNTSHGNEVPPQGTMHFIRWPCYQWGSPCQDPTGNRTTWRPPGHCKEMQSAVVWSCLPFIRSGKNHLARHSERGKKTRQTEEEVGRQHQGKDRPGVPSNMAVTFTALPCVSSSVIHPMFSDTLIFWLCKYQMPVMKRNWGSGRIPLCTITVKAWLWQ